MISQLHYEECGCTKCIFLRNDQIAELRGAEKHLLGEIAALAEENTALWCRLAQADQRLAEIIGYCAQEGRDGEPYDTINSIAMGQYSTRGGGK